MIKEVSIYIHIPFCDSKCYYCSFISSVQNDQIKKQYFEALKNEVSSFDNKEDYKVKTIYVGGGTPSCVSAKHIEDVFKVIKKKFGGYSKAEITIEGNPNSTTEEKLKIYKKIGVNRLSFGVQSFNKKSLNFIGRIQNDKKSINNYHKDTMKILKKARKLGFKNLSVDFILGLPFQRKYQIKRFIRKLSKVVTHFSCYMLTVEEGTKLAQLLPQGISDDILAKQYEIAVNILKKLSFERYEISNFAVKGFESKHNNTYWNGGEYIGFGLAAHSFYQSKRVANTEDFQGYVAHYLKKEGAPKAVKVVEKLTKEQLAEERIMLSLRTREGLDLHKFKKDFYDLKTKKLEQIKLLLKGNFIRIEDKFLRLADKGFLVANEIISELIG